MLYVFHVDVGRMMSFDMTVALSSVDNLKHTIERLHGIPAANIVLLVSGGEMLIQNSQVSCYSAGTDTNPIYMFLTGDIRVPAQPMATAGITQQSAADIDVDLREQVDRCLQLPAVYETVLTRAQLASRLQEMAREEERVCERLVHDHHLQHQGWSAVMANMEDLTVEFRQRYQNFFAAFDRHLAQRDRYLNLLRNFGDDVAQLARIPILPGLMLLAAEDFHGFDDYLDADEVFARSVTQVQQQQQSQPQKEQHEQELIQQKQPPSSGSTSESNGGSGGTSHITEGCDDKNSTSPNKKLKMGSDGDNEHKQQPICNSIQENTKNAAAVATAITNTAITTTSTTTTSIRNNNLNLLQWITSKESHNRTRGTDHNTLKLISDECIQGLGTFNEDIYEKLKTEVQNIIKFAEQNDVKEIKGISGRLYSLEEFKYTVKKLVQDQKELSMSFQLNQNRVSNVRDPSVLPDLCESHKSSLNVMMQNHNKILEHRRCIAKSKEELGANLHTRLRRIVWVENAMSEIDNRLLFYHRCLRRAEKHITIIEQIHQAPCIYVAAVTEVVRRKIFSGEFRQWATKLAEDFDIIHSEEIKRRQLFNSSFEGHFLNILFPGMNDMPPAFANETPLIFDARLPNITKSDIDMLSVHLPHLAMEIQLPDMGPVINFFVSRSGAHQRERMEELLKEQVAAVLLNAAAAPGAVASGSDVKPPQPQRLSELQKVAAGGICCDESETDTETEFEKVLVSMQTVATSTSENEPPEKIARSTITETPPLTQSASTLTDETTTSIEVNARVEVDRLRSLLTALSKLTVECLRMSRDSMADIRKDAQMQCEDLQIELQTLADKCNTLNKQCETHERKLRMCNAKQEEELANFHDKVLQLEDELQVLRSLKETNELENSKLQVQLNEMQKRLKIAQDEKEHAIEEARDQLRNEHETEIESLRCRFKLMTSMEANSKSHDVIDVLQHEAIMVQLRSTLEGEKERAIKSAIEVERALWQSKFFPLNSDSVMKMLEDKERQIEQLREKDTMVMKENFQLKARIDALTNEEGTSWLEEKIEFLRRDKTRLEEELAMEKSRYIEMETSLRCSVYEQHQPQTCVLTIPRSKSSGSSHKYVVLDSCSKGDIVFVVWSMRHRQFMVVQDSPHIYFVHGDSLATLNLRLPPTASTNEVNTVIGSGSNCGAGVLDELAIPLPYYAIGRVIEKEYCQARKDENRYRVSKGSKFYRIKLMALTKPIKDRRDRLESFSTSISRSISHSDAPSSESSTVLMAASTMTNTIRSGTKAMTAIISTPATTKTRVAGKFDVVDNTRTAIEAAACEDSGDVSGYGSKERTVSITSVTEEDEEPLSLLGERCHYISVSEEDEPITATTIIPPSSLSSSKTLQHSVITEQPTALSTLKRDLLLASADIMLQKEQSEQQPEQKCDGEQGDDDFNAPKTSTSTESVILPDIMSKTITELTTTSSTNPSSTAIPCSTLIMPPTLLDVGAATTASEDSDEYRSLEAKDDNDDDDFPITE